MVTKSPDESGSPASTPAVSPVAAKPETEARRHISQRSESQRTEHGRRDSGAVFSAGSDSDFDNRCTDVDSAGPEARPDMVTLDKTGLLALIGVVRHVINTHVLQKIGMYVDLGELGA